MFYNSFSISTFPKSELWLGAWVPEEGGGGGGGGGDWGLLGLGLLLYTF